MRVSSKKNFFISNGCCMLACVGGVGCGDACGVRVPVRGLFARRWAAVASRGAEGRALCGRGDRRCDEVPAAAGGPAVLGRGCERVACEGMCGQAAGACRGLGGRV